MNKHTHTGIPYRIKNSIYIFKYIINIPAKSQTMSCFLKIAEHVGLISVSNQLSLQVLSHLSSLKLQ